MKFVTMSKMGHWVRAFRLRTLPLSLSSIILGSFLAAFDGHFNGLVFTLAAVTTLFLQILSNLANDYGDFVNGVDNAERVGPERALQSGSIQPKAMRAAIALFTLLALGSGIWLIVEGTRGVGLNAGLIFLLLGLAAIGAAIKYTVGKKPYGYLGLGDVAVFLFFGWTGVAGTYFLHTHHVSPDILLPASALGLFCVGVLNLNNMRDREADARAGKRTLVVKIGSQAAKFYHTALMAGALLAAIAYMLLHYRQPWQWIFLITLPLILLHVQIVLRNQAPQELDPQLKKLALTTLLFALSFGTGLIL